ncbi:MAG TPA: 3-dehydroquinate synthase [Terriglobales bacterium]|nr:3-dehydroquinate synthase [Terriglobales bacterium]
MERVEIKIPTSPYSAMIENGILQRVGQCVSDILPGRKRLFVVTSPPIRKLYGEMLTKSLEGFESVFLEIPDGERYKTFRTVEDLARKLVDKGADRKSVVLALGGGVVGDTAGFAASIYMRGIDFIQIPTTLLAQVDASVGGKTGVDLPEGKNLIGTFHHPRAVLIDPSVLATLSDREFRAGLYEVLKYGLIRRKDMFDYMEQNRDRILQRDPEALQWLITASVQVKAEVVAADEKEGDLRRILNFGHTIGHALEAETRYKQFLHGEAVAWGMVAASMLAVAVQKTTPETAQKIIGSILAYASLPKVETRGKKIIRRLGMDKKTIDGVVHFILPTELGSVEVVKDVPEKAIIQAVEELRYLSQSV